MISSVFHWVSVCSYIEEKWFRRPFIGSVCVLTSRKSDFVGLSLGLCVFLHRGKVISSVFHWVCVCSYIEEKWFRRSFIGSVCVLTSRKSDFVGLSLGLCVFLHRGKVISSVFHWVCVCSYIEEKWFRWPFIGSVCVLTSRKSDFVGLSLGLWVFLHWGKVFQGAVPLDALLDRYATSQTAFVDVLFSGFFIEGHFHLWINTYSY